MLVMAAVLVEALVNYYREPNVTKYAAGVLAIIFAVVFQVDATSQLPLTPIHPIAGQVLTGLVIGRGSNFVADFAGKYLSE